MVVPGGAGGASTPGMHGSGALHAGRGSAEGDGLSVRRAETNQSANSETQ